MAEAEWIFKGKCVEFEDKRFEYDEKRWITIGFLHGRMVILAWTQRAGARRIISMRKANEREQEKYGRDLA